MDRHGISNTSDRLVFPNPFHLMQFYSPLSIGEPPKSRTPNQRKDKDMKAQVRPRWISGIAVASLSALIAMTLGVAIVHGKEKAEHVRWDIIVLTPPGATVNAGGQASALNNIGDQITFTGTGTFA